MACDNRREAAWTDLPDGRRVVATAPMAVVNVATWSERTMLGFGTRQRTIGTCKSLRW